MQARRVTRTQRDRLHSSSPAVRCIGLAGERPSAMVDNLLRDALTGAHSRATLQERLREEVERARRYDLPLTLLVADLDHFKSINDAFGHTRGDLVLIGFVERLRGLIRDSDLLFRYGGDEFVLVLLHSDLPQARVPAGPLLDGMRPWPLPGNPLLSVT